MTTADIDWEKKKFTDWLRSFVRKARLVKFRLGLGGGRGPEVYSHDRCRLVGWLDRSSRVVPNVPVSGWLSRGSGGGPWANEHASGQRWVGHQWAEMSEGQGGHGLVAVAARVRRTETDRHGKETKRAHKRGDIKRKKDRREISVS